MSENVGNLTPEVADLSEKICAGLLKCRKQASLYPEAHPRVQNTLAGLKQNLAAHQRLTGQSFFLQVSEVLESVTDRAKPPSSAVPLALLLERRLVEKIVLPPDVTDTELFRFCHALRDDALRTSEKREQVLIDLNQLDRIGLSFYELHDLAPVLGDEEPDAPQREVERDDRFEEIVRGLSPEVREPLRRVLGDPTTTRQLRRIEGLLSRETSEASEAAGSPPQEVPLLREMVLAAVAAGEGEPEGVIENFQGIVQFFEKHANSLVASPRLLLSDLDEESLRRELAQYSKDTSSLVEDVRKIQQQKQKLAAFFRSGGTKTDSPTTTPATPSAPQEPRPESSKERKEEEASAPRPGPGEFLPDVRYDLQEVARSMKEAEPYVPYVQIVVDLLHREETRKAVRGKLSKISKKIGTAVGSRRRFRKVLSATLSGFSLSDVPESQELVLALLGKLESPTETLKVFETLVLPQCGEELTEHLLHLLTERNRKGATRLLCLFSSSKEASLRDTAARRLVTLSQNQTLLQSWAREDPRSLLRPDVFEKITRKIGVDRLAVFFREFFSGSTHQQAMEFIDALPPDLSGAEHVVLAAAEHGSPSVKKAALRRLSRFSSPMVVAALIETVKRNNYKPPDLEEIEGSLRALLAIGGPRVREFLREVRSGRQRFFHIHRREIRKILRELLREEKRRP